MPRAAGCYGGTQAVVGSLSVTAADRLTGVTVWSISEHVEAGLLGTTRLSRMTRSAAWYRGWLKSPSRADVGLARRRHLRDSRLRDALVTFDARDLRARGPCDLRA